MANPCVVAESLSNEFLVWTARVRVEKDVWLLFAGISWRSHRLLL